MDAKATPESGALSQDDGPDEKTLSKKFNRLVRRARAAIFIERAWPRIVPPLGVSGLFLSASWFGLWNALSVTGRISGVIVFSALMVASPLLFKTKSLKVTRRDALNRIDAQIEDGRRPAQTLADSLAEHHDNENDKKLWRLHLKSTWKKYAGKLKAPGPRSDMARRDPYAIRFAIALSMCVGAAVANGQIIERTTQAFDWSAPVAKTVTQPLKVRAWVEPPRNIEGAPVYHYTGDKEPRTAVKGSPIAVDAHKNSVFTLVVSGGETRVFVNGKVIEPARRIETQGAEQGQKRVTAEYKITLTEDVKQIRVEKGPGWQFSVRPDKAPTVKVKSVDTVEQKGRNRPNIRIECSADDDHGIRRGEVEIVVPGQKPEAKPLPSSRFPKIKLPNGKLCRR